MTKYLVFCGHRLRFPFSWEAGGGEKRFFGVSVMKWTVDGAHADNASTEELAELASIIEDMNARDLRICSRIVVAVDDLFRSAGAAATSAALERALQDLARASMV